jgi:hypothetical protein
MSIDEQARDATATILRRCAISLDDLGHPNAAVIVGRTSEDLRCGVTIAPDPIHGPALAAIRSVADPLAEALDAAIAECQSVAEQQAMPDDSWKPRIEQARAALAAYRGKP